MGVTRSAPECQVRVSSESKPAFSYVAAGVCGWQYFMEDYFGKVDLGEGISAFFVLDGHGGPQIAEYCAQEIPRILLESESVKTKQYRQALQSLVGKLEYLIRDNPADIEIIREKYNLPKLNGGQTRSGCCLAIVIVGEDEVVIGNIGACKCYVCYRNSPSKAVLISGNHTQATSEDEERVRGAGGFFLDSKINGIFPFTRSIGDLQAKEGKLLGSSMSLFTLHRSDVKMLVLGSGGLWERVESVLQQLTEEDLEVHELEAKVSKMLEGMIAANPAAEQYGLNNMTALIVQIK